ncbi:MAG: site-2 protease family protein [Bdellovibrionales bacterium]
MNLDFIELGAKLGMFFVPFLFALCFHEFAHGWVAKLRGDNTAEISGRLSLNPMAHADPIGTWLLPLSAILFSSPFFFGWAKPVPVNSRNLRKPREDMFWIAVAGPLSNVFLALVGAVALGLVLAYMPAQGTGDALNKMLQTFIMINLFLALFNLIPVHPLDGGKVIEPFLPARWNMWLLENQGTLSMGLLLGMLLAGHVLAAPVIWTAQKLMMLSVVIAQLLV